MIRLLLDPPRFECAPAITPAELAKLIGEAARACGMRAVIRPPRPVADPSRRIKTPGVIKGCRTCGGTFQVMDRSDCRAVSCKPCRKAKTVNRGIQRTFRACVACGVKFHPDRDAVIHCKAHRLGVGQNRAQAGRPVAVKAPVPAAGKLCVRKHADPVRCSGCGASVPEFELINGECLECAPMGARKTA